MKRVVARIAAIALAVGSIAAVTGVAVSSQAGATSLPTNAVVTVTYNGGAPDGLSTTDPSQVTITGTGFNPSEDLIWLECVKGATTTSGCNLQLTNEFKADANGDFTETGYVSAGTVGDGTCGTTMTDADCVIAIADTDLLAVVATAVINFASGPLGPQVTITPNTGLSNGSTVTITGDGFTASDSLYAVECLATATDASGCDVATATPITANADGTLPATTFTVVAGTIGTGTCGTGQTDAVDCVIQVANAAETDEGSAAISFAFTPVTTTTTTTTTTKSGGSGSKSAAPKATKVVGAAVPGATKTVTVDGTNFKGSAKVTAPKGITATVTKVSAKALTVKVTVAKTVKKGSYTLTIKFSSGKSTTAKLSVS